MDLQTRLGEELLRLMQTPVAPLGRATFHIEERRIGRLLLDRFTYHDQLFDFQVILGGTPLSLRLNMNNTHEWLWESAFPPIVLEAFSEALRNYHILPTTVSQTLFFDTIAPHIPTSISPNASTAFHAALTRSRQVGGFGDRLHPHRGP
jgi:hypothetical protein